MNHFLLLATDTIVTRPEFEWGRIESNSDWILPVVVAVALIVITRIIHKRDTRELHPVTAWTLTGLRVLTILALLLLYLQPQWRSVQERRINSKALVLVDQSLSMGLMDDSTGSDTRAEQVAKALDAQDVINRLRKKHDVAVYRFSEKLEPVASFERQSEKEKAAAEKAASDEAEPTDSAQEPKKPLEWRDAVAPTGVQTRLGEALAQLVDQERDAPVSGIILITDGGQNAGAAPEAAIPAALQAKIPIHAAGIGSDTQPANVRISDFIVPARAFPGDQYAVTGYLQATRMPGQAVTVQLFSKSAEAGNAPAGDGDLVETRDVILGAEGEVVPVRFELSPDEAGRQTLTLKVEAPPADRNPADNRREADVEIVDRKTRVLLLAGGPMRDYRFLRNLLHRDDSMLVDVLLQSAKPGVSQEANQLLDDFPANREEMFQYDCVVAMDPDWKALGEDQINLLEDWVAEQGGGLIVVAGPVYMGQPIEGWLQDNRMGKIRSLYPVTFQRRFATDTSAYSASEPWPIDFTREGLEAEFLWLGDDQVTSQQLWGEFPGVYSYYPVEGAKPGATVLATFSDPSVGTGDERPVYMASQFYGSGRVLYLGSAEMWRLRMVDEACFESLYTKLIRHVSQGRLLRGSSRGALLVDRDRYMLGGTVEVRAQLTDARLEPLASDSVSLQAVEPGGTVRNVVLKADSTRPGMFAGRFSATEEGVYRLELPIPESDEQRLSRRIQVKMPDLERETPQRNDALLVELCEKSGGAYYVGIDAAFANNGKGVIGQLKDRTKTIVLTAAPSHEWQERWLRWFLYIACGLLFLEWLIRRLVKLA
jgi:hypothetical protein